ncbi:UNVERIFIED_CONTAM: hypothetical protein NCL1_52980 [Trichonephila clavipes]
MDATAKEKTVTGNIYLDMLENFAASLIPLGFLFQQDCPSLHYPGDVLNRTFQGRGLGEGA